MVGCCAAFKGFAVNPAREINHHCIAINRCAIFGYSCGRAVFSRDFFQRFVNLTFIGRQDRLFNIQIAKVRDGNLWHNLTFQRGIQILAIFIRGDVQTRLAGQIQPIAFNRFTGRFIQRAADNLAFGLFAKAGFHNRNRHLTGAEARHLDLAGHLSQFR